MLENETFWAIFYTVKMDFYLVSTSTIETRSVFDETVVFYPSTATDDADFLINWKKKFSMHFSFCFLSLFNYHIGMFSCTLMPLDLQLHPLRIRFLDDRRHLVFDHNLPRRHCSLKRGHHSDCRMRNCIPNI